MTGKEKDEIRQIINECFTEQNEIIHKVQSRQSNIDKLQQLFDELVSLWKFVNDNPKYTLEQYATIEALSRHALNMVELDRYIQEQSLAITQEDKK